jgi:hypothetical protein
MPKIIRRPKKRENTRRELKCQKIKTQNMEDLITKAPQWNIKNNGIPQGRRKGESTKRKCLKGKTPG